MSKQLYLEALEALRQRVEAAGEEELERLQDSSVMDGVLGAVTDYIDLMLAAGLDSPDSFGVYLEGTKGDLIDGALLYLAALVVVRRPDLLMEKVNERRHFFAAESAEEPPDDSDWRPDAPGVDVTDSWQLVGISSEDACFWEDDEEDLDDWEEEERLKMFEEGDEDDDSDLWDDDPDRAGEYGDEDEGWELADRDRDEERLARLERMRDEDPDPDYDEEGFRE